MRPAIENMMSFHTIKYILKLMIGLLNILEHFSFHTIKYILKYNNAVIFFINKLVSILLSIF